MAENFHPPHRIIIIGSSCAGKTTLAKNLANILNISHIELDAIHWKANWTERKNAEFREMLQTWLSENNEWAMDGNYSKARNITWAKATTIIWLNYNFPLVFWRAVTRTIRRVATREELYSGNRESFRQSFLSKNSILLWVLTNFWEKRKRYRKIIESGQFSHIRFIEFRKPAEATQFLAHLEHNVFTHRVL